MNNFAECLSSPSLSRLSELLAARIITIEKTTVTNLSRVFGFDPYNSPWHHLFQNSPGTVRLLNNSNENDNLILQALCQAA
ncbi:MAG: hypothetical protein H6731_08510 [Myxococcales bacterium]|nr:MAG: hypothetical protein H6731_08510 [Myxococcales bacterium]